MEIKKYVKLSREVVLVKFVLVPYLCIYIPILTGYFNVVYRGKKKKNASIFVEYV